MTNEWLIGKGVEERGLHNLKHNTGPEKLRKTIKNLSLDGRSMDLDLNPGPSEYVRHSSAKQSTTANGMYTNF